MKSPFDKLDYGDGLVDHDLERREFLPLNQITDPHEQALAILQDALFRLIDAHVVDEGERSRKLALAVQVIVVAARLPLEARIAQLEARLEVLEARLR